VAVPPLRERAGDVRFLGEYFLPRYAALNDLPEPRLQAESWRLLDAYAWPGNIRELGLRPPANTSAEALAPTLHAPGAAGRGQQFRPVFAQSGVGGRLEEPGLGESLPLGADHRQRPLTGAGAAAPGGTELTDESTGMRGPACSTKEREFEEDSRGSFGPTGVRRAGGRAPNYFRTGRYMVRQRRPPFPCSDCRQAMIMIVWRVDRRV
jgi:hypothetical protein